MNRQPVVPRDAPQAARTPLGSSVRLHSRPHRNRAHINACAKLVIDDETDKDVPALLTNKGDELVGMGSWERESAAMMLYARLGVIAPAHRGFCHQQVR